MAQSFINKLRRRKTEFPENEGGHKLHRVLGVRDLTFLGIAAIIGGGIFSSVGKACATGGPGVIWLFLFCGLACGFAAMCYAEFASRIPVAGSAYTYAYASFGELFAWIIGWALLMEYSIGNIYVAFAWSGYFNNLLHNMGIHVQEWLTVDYKSAKAAFEAFAHQKEYSKEALTAWQSAPQLGSLRIILDLPAFVINILITLLVLFGVKESRNASNIMVIIKIVVVILVIIVGAGFINFDNYTPFHPEGYKGIMAGVSAVFFTYIGFDAVSTMAEESKNPKRDLPRGMIYSLLICTVLYILISLVLTGMVHYGQLNVADPLAEVMKLKGVEWMEYIVSISAVIAMTSILLVYQMGQPRIWMSMSRDGLLPKKFAEIHPKYKTPFFSTIVTGIVVGIPILFTDENFVLDFTSIGTLFAFVLVCGGVLLLPKRDQTQKGFKIPFINAKFIFPLIVLTLILIAIFVFPGYFPSVKKGILNGDSVELTFSISHIVFWIVMILLAVYSFIKQWSLIPILGLVCCLYLLTGMGASNWIWFGVWFAIGLIVYFLYGFRKSKLNK